MTTKTTQKWIQKTSNLFGNLFALIYVLLFIPALIFVPPLGFFVADADIPMGGVLFCVLILAIVPLSMPFSIYFIYARFADRHYGKMFFFCFAPLICCVFALAVIFLIVYLHDFLSFQA